MARKNVGKKRKIEKDIEKELEIVIDDVLGDDNIPLEDDLEDVDDLEDLEDKGEIEEVDEDSGDSDDEPMIVKVGRSSKEVEDILFKIPIVDDPLIGTPKDLQKKLDNIALKIKKNPSSKESEKLFNKIHLYMHSYLINVTLKQFPYIKGYQAVDIYQETLIALRFKSIPNFKTGKGMSFLNFSKMCIRRHLITILNASRNKQKDQAINQAISLNSSAVGSDGESGQTLDNVIPDSSEHVDDKAERVEAMSITRKNLLKNLSSLERQVVEEYLSGSSYQDIAKNISKKTRMKCDTKTVDNALLRIRKKAAYLKDHGKLDDFPLFIDN
jgi:RNA polymerase sporulation-specific sigma factor